MIWATVSCRSHFCWLYRASSPSAAKNIISLISVLIVCDGPEDYPANKQYNQGSDPSLCSCGGACHIMWNFSSPTRDWTQALGSENRELLWLWKMPWGHIETSQKAALFHNLKIDFLANLPEYMNNQFWNSTELYQRVGYNNCESCMERLS